MKVLICMNGVARPVVSTWLSNRDHQVILTSDIAGGAGESGRSIDLTGSDFVVTGFQGREILITRLISEGKPFGIVTLSDTVPRELLDAATFVLDGGDLIVSSGVEGTRRAEEAVRRMETIQGSRV